MVEKQMIVPIGQDAPYLKARELVKDKGGLPSNALHDEYLVTTQRYRELPSSYYGAWAREIYVYPERNGRFKIGKDFVDAHRDEEGREWIFPASMIPKDAFDREKVSLFVDPKDIEINTKRVVVLAEPQNIIIVSPTIQTSAELGQVDEKTRMPLEVTSALAKSLAEDQKRWLYRIDGQGVRPVARVFVIGYVYRRGVDANGRPDYRLGVAYASRAQAEQPSNSTIAVATPEQVRLLRAAYASLDRMAPVVRSEELETIRKALGTIEIRK